MELYIKQRLLKSDQVCILSPFVATLMIDTYILAILCVQCFD